MFKKALVSVFILGVLIRLWYLIYPLGRSSFLTVDEAVYGVQSLQILKGDRPVFYPAQAYTGSLSAYVSAIFYFLFGFQPLFLKIVPFVASVLFIYFSYLLADLVFRDKRVSFLTLLISSLGTPFWNNWSSRAGTGYVEASLVGMVVICLTLKLNLADDSTRTKLKLFLLGWLGGVGFWIQPTIVYYLLPTLFYLVFNCRRVLLNPVSALRSFFIYFSGLSLGSLPMILFNFRHHSETASSLLRFPWGLKTAFGHLLFEGLPVIIGVRTANSLEDFFPWLALIVEGIFLSALVLFVFLTTRSFWSRLRSGEVFLLPRDLLLFVFFSTIIIFLLSTPFNQFSLEPRYVFSLYSTVPLVLAYSFDWIYRHSLRAFVLLFLIYLCNWGLGFYRAGPLTFTDRYKVEDLVDFLREKTISAVISDPALGQRVMFYSALSIPAAIRGGGITEARFPEINRAVIQWRDRDNYQVSFVALKGSAAETQFERELPRFVDSRFNRYSVGGEFIVLKPQR